MERKGIPTSDEKELASLNEKMTLDITSSSQSPGDKEAEDQAHSVPCTYFQCPFGCSTVYPVATIDNHIKGHLERMLSYRPLEASVLMIHSLTKNQDRLHTGLQILCKYLDNVCNNPGEEKYYKISEHNKAFLDKVVPVEGAKEFLHAVGFRPKRLPIQDMEMPFLVMSSECAGDTERLRSARDLLLHTQPTQAALHRDIHIYYPSQKAGDFHFPPDFYDVLSRSKGNNPKNPKTRRYKYAIVRIRFPDGVLLQGTFGVDEKLSALKTFVSSTLEKEWQPFILRNRVGTVLSDMNSTLAQLKLVPGAVLEFGFNATMEAEMKTGLYFCLHGPVKQVHHLKATLMRAIRIL